MSNECWVVLLALLFGRSRFGAARFVVAGEKLSEFVRIGRVVEWRVVEWICKDWCRRREAEWIWYIQSWRGKTVDESWRIRRICIGVTQSWHQTRYWSVWLHYWRKNRNLRWDCKANRCRLWLYSVGSRSGCSSSSCCSWCRSKHLRWWWCGLSWATAVCTGPADILLVLHWLRN